jgi:hypothetical protein
MTKNLLRKQGMFFRMSRLLVVCCLLYGGTITAQSFRISQEKTTLEKVVASLEEQFTQTYFSYNHEQLSQVKIEKVDARAATLTDLLGLLKKQTGLHALVDGNNVTFKYIPVAPAPVKKAQGRITGKVIDEENGQPVAGATILIGTNGVTTDTDGSFSITLPKGRYTAVISFVGFGT